MRLPVVVVALLLLASSALARTQAPSDDPLAPPPLLEDGTSPAPAPAPAPAPPAPAPAPAPATPPRAGPAAPPRPQAPPAADAPTRGLFSKVGVGTLAGGAAGLLAVSGLAFLSPCCAIGCGCPIAAATLGGGTALGRAVAGDELHSPMWLPVVTSMGIGAVGSFVAGIAAVGTYAAIQGGFPSTSNLSRATSAVGAASAGAAGAAAVVMLGTGFAAALGATWAAEAPEESARAPLPKG